MKKMRILLSFVLAVLFCVTPLLSMAATADEVIEKLREGAYIDGQWKKVPEQYIKMIEDYFNAYQLTPEQLDEAIVRWNEVKEYWVNTGIYRWEDLSAEQQNHLADAAKAFGAELGATLMLTPTILTVVGPDGRRFVVDAKPIKNTGLFNTGTSTWAIAGGILCMMIATLLLLRRKKVFGRYAA